MNKINNYRITIVAIIVGLLMSCSPDDHVNIEVHVDHPDYISTSSGEITSKDIENYADEISNDICNEMRTNKNDITQTQVWRAVWRDPSDSNSASSTASPGENQTQTQTQTVPSTASPGENQTQTVISTLLRMDAEEQAYYASGEYKMDAIIRDNPNHPLVTRFKNSLKENIDIKCHEYYSLPYDMDDVKPK